MFWFGERERERVALIKHAKATRIAVARVNFLLDRRICELTDDRIATTDPFDQRIAGERLEEVALIQKQVKEVVNDANESL